MILAVSALATTNADTLRHGRELGWGGSKSSKGSGKSSKSSSSKSGKGSKPDHVKYVWVPDSDDGWGRGAPPPPKHPPFWGGGDSSSGKSGKSSGKSGKGSWSGSGKSGKSGLGSSKSGKGSKSSNGSDPEYVWVYVPNSKPKSDDDGGWAGSGSDGGKWGSDDGKWGSDDDKWASDDGSSDDGWGGDLPDSSSPGICGPGPYNGGLDCGKEEFDYCTETGSQGECSDGYHCYDKETCSGYVDGSWDDDGQDQEEVEVELNDDGNGEGEWSDDGYGATDICFSNGVASPCAGGPKGEAVSVEFSYSVETNGVDAGSTVSPMESAILAAVVDYVSATGDSYGVTRVSSSPEDHISDEEMCTPKNSGNDCSIIKGEMTVYADSHAMDACDYSKVVQDSMDSSDFSHIDGVEKTEYLDSSSCADASKIISGEAAVVEEDSLSAAAVIGFAMLAAFLAAAALLLARKFRRNNANRDIDLISVDTDFSGNRYEQDPFASTVDVHKCTSMYCNCNKGGSGTTFLPAPRKANMDKVLKNQGIDVSPTGVDEAQGFFVGDPEPLGKVSTDSDLDTSQNAPEGQDNIIRAAPHAPASEMELEPVREVDNDSQIDTEWESEGEEDLESIPPPPPLPPGKKLKNGSLASDEMSI